MRTWILRKNFAYLSDDQNDLWIGTEKMCDEVIAWESI